MYHSFGKNVSNENPIWRIFINYGKFFTFKCACPPVTLLVLIALTLVSLFFLCCFWNDRLMAWWWSGISWRGFPFLNHHRLRQFFFSLKGNSRQMCANRAFLKGKKWKQLFTFPVMCLRAVTVEIFSFHEVNCHKVSPCFGNWKWNSRALPRNMCFFPSLSRVNTSERTS